MLCCIAELIGKSLVIPPLCCFLFYSLLPKQSKKIGPSLPYKINVFNGNSKRIMKHEDRRQETGKERDQRLGIRG